MNVTSSGDLSRRQSDRRKLNDLSGKITSFRTRTEIKLSPCSSEQANAARNSAPGSFKSLNQKLLKTAHGASTQRLAKPYRAPSSEEQQEGKLRDIKRSLQRFSTGSTDDLSSTGPERKSSAVNTITRAIKRQMNKERSGSQPNLSQMCSESLSPPQNLGTSFSPSLTALSPALAKIEISRGATVSVPPVKLHSDIPVGVRGSPDGASIRSESPLPPSEEFKPPPRIINHHNHHSNYKVSGTSQLPHKVVPTQVVMRSKFSKGQAQSKQRYSLPPPSYSSHVMASSSSGSGNSAYATRKEFALSGHDWSSQMSLSPRHNNQHQQHHYHDNQDLWASEGPPSSGTPSNCGSEHSYNHYQATQATNSLSQGSTIDQGSVVNIEDCESVYSDRPPSVQQYSKYRVSPTSSPNQSTDHAIGQSERSKNKRLNPFSNFFSKKEKHNMYSSNQQLYGSHGHLATGGGREQNLASSSAAPESRDFRTIREYSPRAFKFYMEQRVDNLLKAANERIKRKKLLEEEMRQYKMNESDRLKMRTLLRNKETNHLRLSRAKLSLDMFEVRDTLGKGAFGEVSLVKKKDTEKYYALKTLNKREVLLRNQIAHVKAERDILKEADNEWIVKLFYSFQDGQCLYFVMEYIPGGDLMSLLIKKGTFSEDLARFYTAEMVLAVSSVHDMGFIHRDIKPDNVLICRDGHIKLTDFGLCTGFRWTHDSNFYKDSSQPVASGSGSGHKKLINRKNYHARKEAFSLVGTPNYIAPEVLQACAQPGGGYTKSCDWWSVGVILFEMVLGYAPFYATTPQQTQEKILAWRQSFYIPPERPCSRNAADLMRVWITNDENRLSNLDLIKKHPYFNGIDWTNIRLQQSPYIPSINSAEDISNFDPVEDNSVDETSNFDPAITHTLQNHAFLEFTFRRFFDIEGQQAQSAPAARHHQSAYHHHHNHPSYLTQRAAAQSSSSARQRGFRTRNNNGNVPH